MPSAGRLSISSGRVQGADPDSFPVLSSVFPMVQTRSPSLSSAWDCPAAICRIGGRPSTTPAMMRPPGGKEQQGQEEEEPFSLVKATKAPIKTPVYKVSDGLQSESPHHALLLQRERPRSRPRPGSEPLRQGACPRPRPCPGPSAPGKRSPQQPPEVD